MFSTGCRFVVPLDGLDGTNPATTGIGGGGTQGGAGGRAGAGGGSAGGGAGLGGRDAGSVDGAGVADGNEPSDASPDANGIGPTLVYQGVDGTIRGIAISDSDLY